MPHDTGPAGRVEFEIKCRLPESFDLTPILTDCRRLRVENQSDRYYRHPCRDFARTDEALRIRRVGGRVQVTYKGPRFLDGLKARREVEIEFDPAAENSCHELLVALGFEPVADVIKERTLYESLRHDRVLVAVDQVQSLGRFLEVEIVGRTDESPAVQKTLDELAAQWKLPPHEPRSYLELLLEQRSSDTPPGDRG